MSSNHKDKEMIGPGVHKKAVLPPASIHRGKHYFGCKCVKCGKLMFIAEDPSNGTFGTPYMGPGSFQLTCPFCGTTADYPAAPIASYTG